MPRDIGEMEDEYCPNCGQFTGGESECPNCGAILKDEDDEFEGFHEDDEDMDDEV